MRLLQRYDTTKKEHSNQNPAGYQTQARFPKIKKALFP
jgi:hypothetical protein